MRFLRDLLPISTIVFGAVLGQTYLQGAEGKSVPEQPVTGPVLGYVLDPVVGGLRILFGIPGASTIGDVLDISQPLAYVAVSPLQNYSLAVAADTEEVLLLRFAADKVSVRSLEDLEKGAKQIAISPLGSSAALYYPATRKIKVIGGLPDKADAILEFDGSGLPGLLTALAISEDARVVLLGVLDGSAGFVAATDLPGALDVPSIPDSEFRSRRVRGDKKRFPILGTLRIVSLIGHASAISFVKDSHDAMIADLVNDEIILIQDVTSSGQRIRLAGFEDGISRPVGVGLSGDQRRLFVANSGSSVVAVLDLAGRVTRILSCQCIPSGLYQLAGDSVFRLTEASNAPIQVLDGGATEPRIVFVPRAPIE